MQAKSHHLTMKQIPVGDRPYEKCLKSGAWSLSDEELLAVIIRTGTRGEQSLALARKILQLSKRESGISGIHDLSVKDLMSVRGIGKVKAIQIMCVAELTKRISTSHAADRLCFQAPETIADYYMERFRHEKQEHLLMISLDTKNKLITEHLISKGTVNSALISPREIYINAMKSEAVSIILLHNHPSGDPKPSDPDILITKRIVTVGSMLGIQLLDHIILGDCCYFSFKEQGII